MASIDDLALDIRVLLDCFEGESSLKRLFWELLSYDRVRDSLPVTLLPLSARGLLSAFEVFAASESLTVLHLAAEQLLAGWQLEQIASALRLHFQSCVLLLRSGTDWAVVYPDETTTPHVRFLPLPGTTGQRMQTARSLAALNAADDSGSALSPFEQSELLDIFFPGQLPNLTDIFDDFRRIAEHKSDEVRELHPFLREISGYPLLTARQERGEDVWGAEEPTEAQIQFQRERLVMHNLRLVVWMAFRCSRMGMTLSDVVQEGTIGLMTAAQRFDFTSGNRFSTYAFHWVRQAIYRALHNQCNLLRWPVWIAPKLIDAAKTSEFKGLRAGEKPPFFVGNRLERAFFYETDPCAPVIETEIVRGVRTIAEQLRPIQRQVLKLRFGLDDEDDQTLEAIGQTYGLTRERIRQIEATALKRLNRQAWRRELKPYFESSCWLRYSRYDDGVNGRYRAPLRNYAAIREGF